MTHPVSPSTPAVRAFRGALLHCLDTSTPEAPHLEYIPDALLVVEDGRWLAVGDYHTHTAWLDRCDALESIDGLIVPGFIDAHVHYPQLDIMGQHGHSLLDWLTHYTFPAETAFADPLHARGVAERFLTNAARVGTTTAAVYGTVHASSVDAFFEACLAGGWRMICGKALMDRHAPDTLLDPPGGGIDETRALAARWQGRGRLSLALTPRFAPSCSSEQLQRTGQLLRDIPSLHVQTHLAETQDEVAWVRSLFPEAPHYTGVYDAVGLLGERTLLGHGIHLGGDEWTLIARRGSRVVHCPSSNLFLGSGLFDYHQARRTGIMVALGSDVGAGTSLSMMDTAGDAYRISALQGHPLSPATLFYLITLGGARALGADIAIGNLQAGKEADFCIISANGLTQARADSDALINAFFHLAITHQGRHCIEATYVAGRRMPD